MEVADGQAGFFLQLAARGFLAGFADFLRAAGQGPTADVGRLAAPAQQDVVALEDDDADTDERPGGVFAVRHGLAGASAGGAPAGVASAGAAGGVSAGAWVCAPTGGGSAGAGVAGPGG